MGRAIFIREVCLLFPFRDPDSSSSEPDGRADIYRTVKRLLVSVRLPLLGVVVTWARPALVTWLLV